MNYIEEIEKDLAKIALSLDLSGSPRVWEIEDIKFGDYTTNFAMQTSKSEPSELASKIADELNKLKPSYLDRAELGGRGFVNIFLNKEALINSANRVLKGEEKPAQSGKTVLVEYTDPNPFKEMHIGHLYSNIVGESLARILAFQGNEVKRLNYQGDVGLHVAKAIYGLRLKIEEKLKVEDLEARSLDEKVKFLGEGYAKGASSYEENPEAKEEITSLNKKIYEGSDPEISKLYQKGKDWSLEKFEEVYKRLGTKFDKLYFESEVAKAGKKLVSDHIKDGIFEESDGAVIFDGEKHGLHKRVFVNSLGIPTYEAKELALAEAKAKDFSFDTSIIVTANEVADYFRVVIKAFSLIHPELAGKTKHIGHGFVKLPQGKMSSRSGNIITAEWLLNEAVSRVKREFPDMDSETAEKVGVGAVKYSLLKNTIGRDIVFNFEESISLEGNSGPYLQYTFVRTQSVLAKNEGDVEDIKGQIVSSHEEALLKKLAKFETKFRFTENFSQSNLATYLYELASLFNLFYQQNPILKGENKDFRLGLTKATGEVLKLGLNLLGIEAPDRM